jgi:Fe-S-cluster containining protein
VHGISQRPEVRDAVFRIYAAVQHEIDARRPLCVMSGKCCRFDEYGHRLYVTTIELAGFVYNFEQRPAQPRTQGRVTGTGISLPTLVQPLQTTNAGGCPFQVGKLCGVHSVRPFGCRMFFCDPTASQWQNQTYERFHAELKTLHDRLEVPYFYIEWRAALSALGLAWELGPM